MSTSGTEKGSIHFQSRGSVSADRLSRARRKDLNGGSYKHPPGSRKVSSAQHIKTRSSNERKVEQADKTDTENWKASYKEEKTSKVYSLDLHGKKLNEIAGLTKFSSCKSVDLSCNQIKRIANLDENTEICELKLYSNEIKVIEGLGRLKKLQNLQLQHNQIICIGDGLKELKLLKILNLASNRICDVKALELKTCTNLVFLDLSNNNLKTLKCLNAIPYLEELCLAENSLEECPDASCCKKLQEIDLASNRLSDLNGIKNLPNLTTLDVSANSLETLESLGSSKTIQRLTLSRNKISSLGYIVTSFPNLEVLSVVDNELDSLDELLTLKLLKDLKELYLDGNPVKVGAETDSDAVWTGKVGEILPQLEILDGYQIGNSLTKAENRQLTRPITPSQGLSTKTVKDQINIMSHELSMHENIILSRFESVRSLLQSLPAKPNPIAKKKSEGRGEDSFSEDDSTYKRTLSSPQEVERPSSRCGSRARIREALEFASQNF